jgi:hypothetical protein
MPKGKETVAEVENVSCNAVKEDMNFRIDQDIF